MSRFQRRKKHLKTMTNSPKSEKRWKLIDHTADIRLEVWGADLKELFVNAATALTEMLGAATDTPTQEHVDVGLESAGLDELIVDWLREILFYNQVRGRFLVQCTIEELSDTDLRARLTFGVRPDEEQPDIEIKAVTYHGLAVDKSDEGYCARILFDM
jgi:SHS2 domain-containing protein